MKMVTRHILVASFYAASLACGGCGASFALDGASFRCPACGGADVTVAAGNELEVESIEVEEPACTG